MWALTIISLTGNLMNCIKMRSCFLLWIGCNIGWLIIDIGTGTYSRALLDVVQTIFAVFGYVAWGLDDERRMDKDSKEIV